MFRLQVYAATVSSAQVVQVVTPTRRYSNRTDAMPLCASLAVADMFTVPLSGAAGTVRAVVGTVLSTMTCDSMSL